MPLNLKRNGLPLGFEIAVQRKVHAEIAWTAQIREGARRICFYAASSAFRRDRAEP